jgi:arginine utilization regulatory protein
MQENLSNYLQLLCDNAPVGMIITNSNNTILYVNQSARGLLDYDDDSSATLSSCIPTDEIRCSGGKPKSVYFNKKTLSVSVKTAKLEKQLFDLWYIIDISKEEQQADEMHCLKTILDCIDEGVVMSDLENKITLYNKPYAKSEGLSPDQVIGKHLDEVYDTNQHVTVLETGIPLMDGYKRYFTFDGKEQEGMGKTYPVIKDNKVIATFSVVRNVKKIRWLLQKAVEFQGNLTQKVRYNGTKYTFKSIIGESEAIVNTIKESKTLAMSPSPILIYGETGTGKELFAQSIHNNSPCADHPFVAINCAAVPESLLESILFGTVKGSFTGAQNSQGVFEQAENGTLFLDEINSMPMAMQAKLLRALQEKSIRRVGATYEIPVKCRIITSSNEEPEECVKNGTLRDDLYYRLALLRVNIPPLRERDKDVEVLVEHFLKNKARLYGKKDIKLSTEFINYLYQHPWPGNVRELEHTIESCIAIAEDGDELHLYHLPPHLRRTSISQDRHQATQPLNDLFNNIKAPTLATALREVEKRVILISLQNHHWNITRSARAIGVGRQNLQYRMRKLNIEKPWLD